EDAGLHAGSQSGSISNIRIWRDAAAAMVAAASFIKQQDMVRPTNNVWLHRFACGLAFATLFLVALGGVVTTKGVGMAVPDWPTTYGEHMFLFPPSKWMAGIFDEHSHRLWASLVGL